MKRMGRSLGLIFGLFCMVNAPLWAGTVLKIATLAPDGSTFTDLIREAGEKVESATQGRVEFKVYPGGVMGTDQVVLRKMRTGQLHGSTFTAGGLQSAFRDFQILSLPFLFNDYGELAAVRKEIEPFLVEKLNESGYVSFGIIDSGFVYMLSQHPIRKVEDLRGRKVWVPEGDMIGNEVFSSAGVPPTPLPLPDVLTGLQTGLLDTVSGPPVGVVVLQWFTRVQYLTEQPLIFSYATLAFSERAWNKIPPEDREQVEKVLRDITIQADRQVRLDNEEALQTLKKQGIQFVAVDPAALEEMRELGRASTERLIERGTFDAELYQRIQSILTRYRQEQSP